MGPSVLYGLIVMMVVGKPLRAVFQEWIRQRVVLVVIGGPPNNRVWQWILFVGGLLGVVPYYLPLKDCVESKVLQHRTSVMNKSLCCLKRGRGFHIPKGFIGDLPLATMKLSWAICRLQRSNTHAHEPKTTCHLDFLMLLTTQLRKNHLPGF